jgi:ABC-type branched-subunit amino acid transport system ATPase component
MTAETPVLQLHGISKSFGSLLANDHISLSLQRGEVLALLGENGAGKSTLVSILFGHYLADAGHIEVEGQALPPGQPKAALAAGIGMVHQHFTLADALSVLDNVMLGTEPLWQLFSRRGAARTQLLALSQRFGLAVDPQARVADLSVGERQRVEILKALYRGARILILDERHKRVSSCLPLWRRWWRKACQSSSSATSWAKCCGSATALPCCAVGAWWPCCRRRAPARRNWLKRWWAAAWRRPGGRQGRVARQGQLPAQPQPKAPR